MPTAKQIVAPVLKNSAPIFLARVVGNDGDILQQADLNSSGNTYSIYSVDSNAPDTRTAVTNHSGVALTVSSVVFDTPQKDELWKNDDGEYVDSTGYNLKVQPDISSSQAFPTAGVTYLMEITLNPVSGQDIKVVFMANCK